jgi:hypothetical protein
MSSFPHLNQSSQQLAFDVRSIPLSMICQLLQRWWIIDDSGIDNRWQKVCGNRYVHEFDKLRSFEMSSTVVAATRSPLDVVDRRMFSNHPSELSLPRK